MHFHLSWFAPSSSCFEALFATCWIPWAPMHFAALLFPRVLVAKPPLLHLSWCRHLKSWIRELRLTLPSSTFTTVRLRSLFSDSEEDSPESCLLLFFLSPSLSDSSDECCLLVYFSFFNPPSWFLGFSACPFIRISFLSCSVLSYKPKSSPTITGWMSSSSSSSGISTSSFIGTKPLFLMIMLSFFGPCFFTAPKVSTYPSSSLNRCSPLLTTGLSPTSSLLSCLSNLFFSCSFD